jgi:antibiotic biosynthesis monooxygenase (ABM) superfamily enzyme
MIARVWRGITTRELADAYLAHIQENAVPRLKGVPGLEHSYVLRREQGDRCEFQVVTLWDGMDAMRAWAGGDPDRAVYLDEEDRFLLDMEPLVRLYEMYEILD